MRPLSLTNKVRRRTRKENPMPYRLIGALCFCVLGPLQQAWAESCASILARAEYPEGRDITVTVPTTVLTPGGPDLDGTVAHLSYHSISLSNALRIPDDAPGPITLALRLTHDLPKENNHFKTDMPGVGLSVAQGNNDQFGTPFTLGPGQSLRDVRFRDLHFALSKISDELAPGVLDLSRLPGVKLECADEEAALAWVVHLGGSLNIQSATCEVQQDQVVDLGEHPSSSLMREGDTTPWVDFALRFSNCQPFYGTPSTNHLFNGDMLDQTKNPNWIAVSVQGGVSSWAVSESSPAAGVRLDGATSTSYWLDPLLIQLQMQVEDLSGTILKWDSYGAVSPDDRKTEYSIPMRARYYRQDYSEAPLEPGQKNASAVLMIEYR